jgi:acyl-CoA reductase-like NAD-dependent aldehyde dehydrogenase
LIGAIAAGCTAVVKPSEVSANTSAILAELLPKYLDTDAYRIVNGAVPESTKLLELKWDKILYTGNGHVGRIVMSAAAKHLTPVVLELGGKSPVIVTKKADLKMAAYRITHGKFLNNGQTCIAPDYLLVESSVRDEIVEEIKKQIAQNWGEDPSKSSSYSRIINAHHYKRITSLLDRSKGKVLHGGNREAGSLYLEPTIVSVTAEDSLMEDELFAPILPVVTFETLEEAVDLVNSKDTPLALYVFSEDETESNYVLDSTRSGGTCVNDVVVHIIPTNLPFGGVGESGMGAYQGKESFMTFSHRRSTVYNTCERYLMDDLRALPYPDPQQVTVAE